MLVFGKRPKKRSEKGIPVDIVRDLASKGMSEQEIVSVLRKKGYSPYEIDKALSIALKSTITGTSGSLLGENQKYKAHVPQFTPRREEVYSTQAQTMSFSPRPQPQERSLPEFHTIPSPAQKEEFQPMFTFEKSPLFPPNKEDKQEIIEGFRETTNPPLQKPPLQTSQITPETASEITLEEIIEGIVADKWTRFEEIVERLRKRDDDLQKQIIDIRKEIDAIKDAIRKSEESFLAKLEEHSEHVSNIEAKIGSIEKVFKEFLPELTESMRLITEAIEKTKKSG